MKTLVLISDSFPYGSVTENSFISPEIEPLSKKFDRVIIAPRVKRGVNKDIDLSTLPDNVEISDALIIKASIWKKLRAIPSMLRPILYDIRHTSGSLREIIAYSSFVDICRRDIEKMIADYALDVNHTLFYTFWFDFTTAALAEIKDTRIVTRTHNHDLYENRYPISRWWRKESFQSLIECYPVATAGVSYLQDLYPDHKSKVTLKLLGTTRLHSIQVDTSLKSREMVPHHLNILGIARVHPDKGILRQMETIKRFAEDNPSTHITYTHIGDGPLMPKLKELVESLPPNLDVELLGALHNIQVHDYLSSNYFDFVVLLSVSEGLPIALCESISYGIPFIATNAGGVAEIVPEDLLPILPLDYSYEDFSRGVKKILTDPSLNDKLLFHWERNYNALTLRKEFANHIRRFLD